MSPATQDSPYAVALNDVIAHGDQLVKSLPKSDADKLMALDKMTAAVEDLGARTNASGAGTDFERRFLESAAQMRAGCLLVSAANAVQTGDSGDVRLSISSLKTEAAAISGGEAVVLKFEKDLLNAPVGAADDETALETFKSRAARTIDNMVTEASEVIGGAVKKFADKFREFVDALVDLSKSFSAEGPEGVIRVGLRKIADGLNAIGEFLKSDKLKDAIGDLKEMVKNFDLNHVLAFSFQCDRTKQAIDGLKSSPSRTRQALEDSGKRMAETASRYVLLLNRARWIITAIGVAGSLLALTGVAAHYAALGTPIAYAVVALAVVLIGYDFAASRMPAIIAGV